MRLAPTLPLALFATLALTVCAPVPDAAAKGQRAAARTAVMKSLARQLPASRSVACRAASGTRTWRCRWRAATRRTKAGRSRCSGLARVVIRRRARVRHSRKRCRWVAERNAARRSPIPVPASPRPAPPETTGPTPPSTGKRPFFGFNDNAIRAGLISAADDAALTQRVGADVHRLTLDWRWLEPLRGKFNWTAYDEIYREMRARGIRPLFILMFSPTWALDPATPCSQWHYDCRLPPGRAHQADWERIAAMIAARYPEAAGVEIWNEPNETTFWQTGADPRRYAELLRGAYTAIKRVAPDMRVVGGGPSNRQHLEGTSMTQAEFLRRMYAAGAGGAMDALSVHPYPWALSQTLTLQSLDQAREARDAAGDRDVPLWVTEIGLSTGGFDRYAFSFNDQARGLTDLYRTLDSMDDVDAILFHTLLGADAGPGNREAGYAVLEPDRAAKPAYCALGRLRSVDACPSP